MSERAVKKMRTLLGPRVRAIRKEAGLSQEALGRQAHLSGKFVGEVERGEKSISVDSLYRLAQALAIPLGNLVAIGRKSSPEAERVMALVRKQPARMQARAYQVLKAALARRR
jgi:transcriptional regulator with XRE-family HTH domain